MFECLQAKGFTTSEIGPILFQITESNICDIEPIWVGSKFDEMLPVPVQESLSSSFFFVWEFAFWGKATFWLGHQ